MAISRTENLELKDPLGLPSVNVSTQGFIEFHLLLGEQLAKLSLGVSTHRDGSGRPAPLKLPPIKTPPAAFESSRYRSNASHSMRRIRKT